MSKRLKLVFLTLIIFYYRANVVYAYEIDVISQVTNVVDGDTFDLANGERVRLGDVSAPEIDEPGGSQATSVLIKLIDGKKVFLDTDPKRSYGRLVSVVYLKYNSTHYKNINWVLLQNQYFSLTDYPNEFNPSTWTKYVRYAANPTPPPPKPEPEPESDPPDPTPSPPPDPEPIPDPTPTPPSESAPMTHYTLTITTEGQGTINHTTGTKSYEENSEISITATPQEYWKIENWILNGEILTNQNTIKFNITQNTKITIHFSIFLPDCSLLFKIVDEYGKSLESASIDSIIRPEHQNSILLVSGADGEAEIAPLYNGNYLFKIEKDGYMIRTIELWLDKDEARYEEISLVKTKINLFITLTDSSGFPLDGVTVESISQPENQNQIRGICDEEGVIVFDKIVPGTYSFKALGRNVLSVFEVETDQETSFTVQIETQCELFGTILDSDGIFLNEISVVSIAYPEGQEPLNVTCNGVFNFSGLLPGSYLLRFKKNGYESVNKAVYLSGYVSYELRIVMFKPVMRIDARVIVLSMFIGFVLIALYLGSEKSISFYQILDKIGSRSTVSVNHMESIGFIEPAFYGSDKGIILKVMCIDGGSSLSDIQYYCDLDDANFWDAFYGLLSDGSVESSETGDYFVNNELARQWKHYLSQEHARNTY